MLLPKKVKHRRWQKPRRMNKGVATRINTVSYGQYGIMSLSHAWVSSRQIEAARRVITRYIRRSGKLFIRVFPDRPVTRKGSEVPMGSGKGSPDHYVATIKPGTILFELDGVPEDIAKEALVLAGYKLPVKVKFVKKV